MLNQLNTTTKRELDARYLAMQGSKEIINTSGTISIPDYGLTESIEMYFKPSQKLNGYKKPWAGGAGKNKVGYSYTQGGLTTTELEDGTFEVSGHVNDDYPYIGTNTATCGSSLKVIVKVLSGDFDGCGYRALLFDGEKEFGIGMDETNQSYSYETSTMGHTSFRLRLFFYGTGNMSNVKLQVMVTDDLTATNFEPYSNICPIIGQDKATFSWNDTERTMNFGTTYYGGIVNFDGTINSDWQRIASYNGETLSGEWLSDRDKYVAGTTPTKGAEVVYKTTPSTIRVAKPSDISLTDEYPIEYNGYKAIIKYQPKNTILEEAKSYTNQEIAKLGLPQAPTSNGTYQLVCTVASGVPTLSWESTT